MSVNLARRAVSAFGPLGCRSTVNRYNMIIKITLKNGTVAHGPATAVIAWLSQHCSYWPHEVLPAIVEISPFATREEANRAHEQWVSALET